ncbi:MAG: choice-of-anchor J domain-containing protein [Bacteroidales bacterium]|jgi:PKD repeat protein|nr:choice-of-anchor J domain-containing protein [Bacteroidales bacterium]
MKVSTKKIMPSLIALLIMVCFSTTSYAQNMVSNPGFEEWSDGAPSGWMGEKSNIGANNVVQSDDSHTGSYACQLINTESAHKRFTTKPVTVETGQIYTITFYLKGSGEIRTGLYDNRTDASGYFYNDYAKASDNWIQVTQEIEAANSLSSAEFIFSVRNSSGSNILIDDVTITSNGGAPSLIANFKADQTIAPIGTIINFTDLSTGEPVQWNWSITGPQDFDSNEQNPSFTFMKTGAYDVKLVVSNEETSAEKEELGYIIIGDFTFFQNWNDKEWRGWSEVSVEGNQKWEIIDKFGIDDSPCIRMSGYDQSPVANEDWLLSPEFTLEAGNKSILSFYNAKGHEGPDLEAYFTNDYNGDVKAANWTKIDFTLCTGEYTWTHSGNISLSQYSGTKCRIAFKYLSTNDKSCIWEIDDIVITKDDGTAIDNSETVEFNIYPNPSIGAFFIDTQCESNVRIYSIQGHLIKECFFTEKTQIDMSAEAKGIYLVQIVTKNGISTVKKIIVQ